MLNRDNAGALSGDTFGSPVKSPLKSLLPKKPQEESYLTNTVLLRWTLTKRFSANPFVSPMHPQYARNSPITPNNPLSVPGASPPVRVPGASPMSSAGAASVPESSPGGTTIVQKKWKICDMYTLDHYTLESPVLPEELRLLSKYISVSCKMSNDVDVHIVDDSGT